MIRACPWWAVLCFSGLYVQSAAARSISFSRIAHTSPGRMPVSCCKSIIALICRDTLAVTAFTRARGYGQCGFGLRRLRPTKLQRLHRAQAVVDFAGEQFLLNRPCEYPADAADLLVHDAAGPAHPHEFLAQGFSRIGPNSLAGVVPYSRRSGFGASK